MKMKRLLSILVLGLLLIFSTQCFAEPISSNEETKLHGSIEAIGYFERINGTEWNLNLWYDVSEKIKIGIRENILQYQEWQCKDNEYNTEVFLIYKVIDEPNEKLEFYFVPFNTIDSPYFKVKYSF
jgi:hypothetical protein